MASTLRSRHFAVKNRWIKILESSSGALESFPAASRAGRSYQLIQVVHYLQLHNRYVTGSIWLFVSPAAGSGSTLSRCLREPGGGH